MQRKERRRSEVRLRFHCVQKQTAVFEVITCHTPTTALAMRMSRMTKGSTNAVTCSSESSNQAKTWTDKARRTNRCNNYHYDQDELPSPQKQIIIIIDSSFLERDQSAAEACD